MATLARIEKRRENKRNGHSVKCAHTNEVRYAHYASYVCTCSKENS